MSLIYLKKISSSMVDADSQVVDAASLPVLAVLRVTCSINPPTLNIGVFTTSAVDNDHDPTATSTDGSFYGTGISLF